MANYYNYYAVDIQPKPEPKILSYGSAANYTCAPSQNIRNSVTRVDWALIISGRIIKIGGPDDTVSGTLLLVKQSLVFFSV